MLCTYNKTLSNLEGHVQYITYIWRTKTVSDLFDVVSRVD